MEKWIKKFERIVVIGLLAMMVVVVFLSTIELGVILVMEALDTPRLLLLDINELLKVDGFGEATCERIKHLITVND